MRMAIALGLLALSDQAEVLVKGPPPQTLKGEVVRQNLKGIVLRIGEKPVLIPWVEIDTVNGRPAREHVAQVRTSIKDSACPDCRGGLVPLLCPDCLGTSKVYNKNAPCAGCSGTGLGPAACRAPGCEKGRVVCTGPCLKRASGIWIKETTHGWSRLFWYKWPGPAGAASSLITEIHLGEVFEYKEVEPFAIPGCAKCAKSPCRPCRESATFVEAPPRFVRICEVCGGAGRGAGRMPCVECRGAAVLPCVDCLGAKVRPVPESAVPCATCQGGKIRCATCNETGLLDPRVPARGAMPAAVRSNLVEFRKGLEKVGDASFAPTHRIRLQDGRSFEGLPVQPMSNGIVFVARSGGELQGMIVLAKQGYGLERLAAPPPPAPVPVAKPAPDVPKPAPGPDTVVLKDGTTVNGKVVGKSELMVIVQTPEGKLVKIEAEKVAEIRSKPKAPK